MKQAAEHYGCKVNRGDMICCPFHDDRHPSMKLNRDYFYCFGCGATGDVIDFVARLFGLSSYEAAKKLAYDFGLDPDKPPAAMALKKPYPLARAFRDEEMYCQRVLCDYLHLLEHWKIEYAPQSPEDDLDDRLCGGVSYDRVYRSFVGRAHVCGTGAARECGGYAPEGRNHRRTGAAAETSGKGGAASWRRTSNRVRPTSPSGLTARASTKPCFVMIFSAGHKIIYTNGAFFTPDGRVTDDLPLRSEIFDELRCCAVSNIPRKISNIVELMKLAALLEDFPPEADRIHLANGTLMLDGSFTEGKPEIVRCRLPVAYNPVLPHQPAGWRFGWAAFTRRTFRLCRNISATA